MLSQKMDTEENTYIYTKWCLKVIEAVLNGYNSLILISMPLCYFSGNETITEKIVIIA